ncbi:J domain-containing protein [Ascoidea rubescens DSM 1968]|uniref:DnaJ-domain-containing protein n=1 Tax=Ascoidea rubescens DSM 1968 TaxID=1344418 RepID=A0A1D2VR08_9ASCO|nr:DnaJ-domain-containing protein [Ascoidea rubescens DSM 1968]ODV64028.1 DnaJ-domain-containing protein [Ascoidea rubescens DSM 1968]
MSSIPFPNLDPYETLEAYKDSSPIEIKKQYRKLCLKYHPDKVVNGSDELKEESKMQFEKISFAYYVLQDDGRKKHYDEYKDFEFDRLEDDSEFNWKDYFDVIKGEKITEEVIEKDKKNYQNSDEERQDILKEFLYLKGNFLDLFENIPHLEFSKNEEERIYNLVSEIIENEEINKDDESIAGFDKYKKTRKSRIRHKLRQMRKEAKEAEELMEKLKQKDQTNSKKRKIEGEDDLKQIIMARQSNRLDNLISKLEAKYVKTPKSSKRSRKTRKVSTK